MVGATGIEPVTPSMSTRCLKPNPLRLLEILKSFIDVLPGLFTPYRCRALPWTLFVLRRNGPSAMGRAGAANLGFLPGGWGARSPEAKSRLPTGGISSKQIVLTRQM